jgi:hypothetical protein
MIVHEAMDRRLLSRGRACQRVDSECSQAGGAEVAWHKGVVGGAVLDEVFCEVRGEAAEGVEAGLGAESVV